MKWLNSLRIKVLLAYVVGVVVSIALVVVAASAVVNAHGELPSGTSLAEVVEDMTDKLSLRLSSADVADVTQEMADNLSFNSEGLPTGLDMRDFVELQWVFISMKQETAYRVLDEQGRAVLHSAAGPGFWPQEGEATRLATGRFDFVHEGVTMRAATERVVREGRVWYFQLAVSARFMHLMYRAFALPFTGAGIGLFSVVLLFVFGTCVFVTLRYTLRPLREISLSAAGISPRALHARLNVEGVPSEVEPLVSSFNRVLERLENGYRVQQEFLATAAHELKTPLALIRAQVELSEPSPRRDELLQDVEHMTRQVQQLLRLAEVSEVQNYRPAPVAVHAVAEEATQYLQRMAQAAGVRLELQSPAQAVVWEADRAALFTLLKNLLENAVQHAPAGTAVTVRLSPASLEVRDAGPGVEAAQLPHIFSRFWRGAHRRDEGAGLGLAICQEIALAHGWVLRAERAEPGLRVQLLHSEQHGFEGAEHHEHQPGQ